MKIEIFGSFASVSLSQRQQISNKISNKVHKSRILLETLHCVRWAQTPRPIPSPHPLCAMQNDGCPEDWNRWARGARRRLTPPPPARHCTWGWAGALRHVHEACSRRPASWINKVESKKSLNNVPSNVDVGPFGAETYDELLFLLFRERPTSHQTGT